LGVVTEVSIPFAFAFSAMKMPKNVRSVNIFLAAQCFLFAFPAHPRTLSIASSIPIDIASG
jgi:hypothetical protein